MEERQHKTVYGYVRNNYHSIIPIDIIKIVLLFYIIRINSNILTSSEQSSLLNLLFENLNKKNKNIKSIDTKLLYRASEHAYSAAKFHECCDTKGPTVVIIHNEYDHVFGFYASTSWMKCNLRNRESGDMNAFIWSVRPNIDAFHLKEGMDKGTKVIWSWRRYGPILGKGNDIWICNECNEKTGSGCALRDSCSFKFDAVKLTGAELDDRFKTCKFIVKEYEVFSINIE